jgi:hypothetical protein
MNIYKNGDKMKNEIKTIIGLYGKNETNCRIFVYNGWYCIQGSVNVNYTIEELDHGVNVETIGDSDFFTAEKEINELNDLIREVDDYLEGD